MICQVNHYVPSRVAIPHDQYGHLLEDLWLSVNVAMDDLSWKCTESRDVRDEGIEEMPACIEEKFVVVNNNIYNGSLWFWPVTCCVTTSVQVSNYCGISAPW